MGAVPGESNGQTNEPYNGSFSSLVAAAHELKSPLVLIRQLSLMLEDGKVNLADRKRMLNQISLTSERALRLTSDLTRSVNLTDAFFQLEPINPQRLCEDIVHELKPLFAAHDRKIILLSHRHPLLLIANRDLLRRIIINFSDNALHYADINSPVEIHLATHDFGQTVRLGIRDYGPALPVDLMESLQTKLTNANTAVHARPQSSGLGLNIARQFADAMNGKIGMIRHRDGSTFYIDLRASSQQSLL